MNRSVLRGRVLSRCSTHRNCSSVIVPKSRPRGRYCRVRPLAFSLLPRCQAEYGSAKYQPTDDGTHDVVRRAVSECASRRSRLRRSVIVTTTALPLEACMQSMQSPMRAGPSTTAGRPRQLRRCRADSDHPASHAGDVADGDSAASGTMCRAALVGVGVTVDSPGLGQPVRAFD